MLRRWVLSIGLLASLVVPLFQAMPAKAETPISGPEHRGYFHRRDDNFGDSVIEDGINPTGANNTARTESFISIMKHLLNGGEGTGQNQTGAEFIILTMLGEPVDSNKGLAHDPEELAEWEASVRYYNSQGWIDWDVDGVSHVYNTYWQGNGTGTNPDDDAYYTEAAVDDNVIVFHQTGAAGQYYRIRKACGNPIADIDPIIPPPAATYRVSLSGPTGNTVLPGDTVTLPLTLRNTGDANSPPGKLLMSYPGPNVVRPCPPGACNPPTAIMSPVTPGNGAIRTFRTTSPITGGTPAIVPASSYWYWDTVGIVAHQLGIATVTFQISPTATAGPVTFDAYYEPGNAAGIRRHITITYTVVSRRTPTFAGVDGDIHAGGNICGQTDPGTGGNVTGSTGSNSYGTYVISASGVISNVRSNKNGALDNLKISVPGGYKRVCRPDLLKLAQTYTGGTFIGNTFDVTGKEGVYIANAPGGLTLNPGGPGTVSRKLTVVNLSGSISVANNIAIASAATAAINTPSLGLIARDNITIKPAVTRLDAYMFASQGFINTCEPSDNSCSTNLLVINGFLMANNILFHRLGPFNTSGTVPAEQITLNSQIYLNPPKFFGADADDVLLEGQGERQPLF